MANLETILNIKVEGTSQMVKLKDQITQTEAGLKKLKEAQKKAGDGGKVFTKEIVAAEIKLKSMRKELNQSKNDTMKMNTALSATGKSYNALTKQNAALSVQLRKLSDPLGKNKKEFDKLSGQIDKNTTQLKKMDSAMGRSQRNVGNYGASIGKMAVGIGAAIMAFKSLERAIGAFVDFEFQIKQVGVISGATAEELAVLEQSAKDLGSSTAFTAGEVAGLQKELAKLGFDPTEINNMTDSVLDLAFAFGDDLGQTAEQVGIILKSFNLDASETSHVTDIMAGAFSNTALDLEKFSVGMPKVASIAKTMGFSFEDTTVLLGALADTGMEASTSATALKNIFLKLADPAGDLAQSLGRNITSIDQLIPALKELDAGGIDVAEMLEITDKRSVTAFASLLSGADNLEVLNKKINDSEGLTKEFADVMRDSLKGSIDETKSAAEGLAIAFTEDLAPVLSIILEGFQLLFNLLKLLSPVIISVATSFITYKTVMMAAHVWTKAVAAGQVALRVASIALMYGTRGLTMSMRALNIAIKANPIGLLVSVAAGAVAMFASWGDETEDLTENVHELTEAEQKLKDKKDALARSEATRMSNQAKDIQEVRSLINLIKDETKERKDRLKAVEDLNKIAGTNIKNLKDEKKLAKELEGAYKDAVAAIKGKYLLQASEENILNLIKEELELEKEIQHQKNISASSTENLTKKVQELEDAQKALDDYNKKNGVSTIGQIDKTRKHLEDQVNFRQQSVNFEMGRGMQANDKIEKKTKKITELQEEQLKVQKATDKVINGLIVKSEEDNDNKDRKLTLYEKLQEKVTEEQNELKRLIILRNKDKVSQKEVDDQIKKLATAKGNLAEVDKELAKETKKINDALKDEDKTLEIKIKKTQDQIEADEKMLENMQKLSADGADLTKEIIQQSIDIAKAKLDMALLTIKASDESTDAEVANINRLKGELARYQAELDVLGDTSETPSGWLNKTLFGTGEGEDGDGFTGRDFLGALHETMSGVMGIMSEVSALQHQQLDTELGTLETNKQKAVEVFENSARAEVMTEEQKAIAIENIEKKFDDDMLKLKQDQFKRDQKMQISQAIMAGAMAIMNIWSSKATGNAIADAIIKGIMTTAMVAMTGIQVATIKAQAPPTAEFGGIEGETFAAGGMVQGKSHAEGGEKFAVGGRVVELEGGEAVINKKSTSMFRPMLSRMNEAGGGKKFADGGMVFATDMLETQAIQMENQLLNHQAQEVLLVEADVTNSQNSVANIEAKASF